MGFRVVYWNIWLENQRSGVARERTLTSELIEIIEKHQPDIIGLNEVLRHTNHTDPAIINVLQDHGYKYTHFAPASPYTKEWIIGAGIASRLPLDTLDEIELGYDTRAEQRGFPGHSIKAISCSFSWEDVPINLIVAHLICLRANTLKDHYRQSKNLKQYVTAMAPENAVIGGDFNEPRSMPKSFYGSTRTLLNHRTGSLSSPTWRFNALRFTPLRANLDRLFWTKQGSLQLKTFKVIAARSSDHLPLFAEFTVSQPSNLRERS